MFGIFPARDLFVIYLKEKHDSCDNLKDFMQENLAVYVKISCFNKKNVNA
jgi:hypothetical protein